MNKFFSALLVAFIFATACSGGDTHNNDADAGTAKATCPDGYEACGAQCMPKGNSCCPDDSLSCAAGTLCSLDNACVASSGTQNDCIAGYEDCGTSCMEVGHVCCAATNSSCLGGWTCVANKMCQKTGSAPTTTSPVTNTIVTVTPGGNTGTVACGNCPNGLSGKTCSGWVGNSICEVQSCVCTYVDSRGSDTWYVIIQTGHADHVETCAQCSNKDSSCTSQQVAAAQYCANKIIASQ